MNTTDIEDRDYEQPPWWRGTDRGKVYRETKKAVPNPDGRNQHSEVGATEQPESVALTTESTADKLAKEFGTSPATIKRDAQPIATIRAALAEADLLHFVAELRDVPEGRLLQLINGVPEAERFELYRLVGIRVIDNDPLITGRAHKGHRTKPDARDMPGTSQTESNAADGSVRAA